MGRRSKDEVIFQERLNDLYREIYNIDDFVELFIYLTSDQRRDKITKRKIINYYNKNMIAVMIKKYDPTLYYTSYADRAI